MARRPVFTVYDKPPFYRAITIEFTFNPGFSATQKQKNIVALHNGYEKDYGSRPLEISSKSLQPEGISLSAFNLTKHLPSLGKSISVECAYQGSKVFEDGGPYCDLYLKTSREAKKDERLRSSGRIISFKFEGEDLDIFPTSCFYDWLYIRALIENPELNKKLLSYSAFTDIEFNPEKSVNCQARAAAVFVSLNKLDLLSSTERYSDFRGLFLK